MVKPTLVDERLVESVLGQELVLQVGVQQVGELFVFLGATVSMLPPSVVVESESLSSLQCHHLLQCNIN